MTPQGTIQTIELSEGRTITVETGRLAKQADGSVVVRMGNTMLLATVVSKKTAGENVDFLPLSVDYQEKFASTGRIPGGFQKREGRLSDQEILTCRIIDRALRPLFPSDYHADTQVAISLISADYDVLPDALAGFAASCAIMVSDIPFNGPMAEVRVAKVEDKFVVNPTPAQMELSAIDMIVGGTEKDIIMVEGEMKEVSELDMLDALRAAHEVIIKLCQAQKELEAKVGKTVKREYCHETHDEELREKIYTYYDQMYAVVEQQNDNKDLRKAGYEAVKESFLETLPEDHTYSAFLIKTYFHDIEKKAARNLALDHKKRLDGRNPEDIRYIWGETGYLPSAHGSAIFTRGETQSLTTVTLGTKLDEKMVDNAMFNGYLKFMLHYNFPAFSTGEVRPNRGPGRREIGHGNLALRGIQEVLPSHEDNPYTIRIVSDILESNGSSSMATVCAGIMALMDAGVKIKAPVSGIAMGMISDPDTGKHVILSDILGDEDHLGDMDFKVVGTAKGITAVQMDIKVDGLSFEVLEEALMQSNRGRAHILGEMMKVIDTAREEYRPMVPRLEVITIEKDMIGAVIGPGGKVVQDIQKTSGATVTIEEKDDVGLVNIFANNKEAMDMACERVRLIVTKPEVGQIYTGKVKNIKDFGAFIEILPGKDGLLHISEIKWERVETMEGVLELGEEIQVKLIDIDKRSGKMKLSRKVLLPKPE